MEWSYFKPDLTEECILVTATLFRAEWEYKIWQIKKLYTDEMWYMGLLTGDGEEYGDLADLKADKYLILPKQ